VDGNVGLYKRDVLLAAVVSAPDRADDAVSDGVIHAERRTDGDHPLAGLEPGRVADLDYGEVAGLDLEQGDVGLLVRADDPGVELASIRKPHRYLVGVTHHMVVGEHITIRGNDETRSGRATFGAGLRSARQWSEKAAEDIRYVLLAVRARQLRLCLRADRRLHIDYRGTIALDQADDIGKFLRAGITGHEEQGNQEQGTAGNRGHSLAR